MTIKEAFIYTKQQLSKAGIDDPAFDALYLFEHIFSLDRKDITLYGDKEVTHDDFDKLCECIKRRSLHEPIQYIIGKWYFMGNKFKVAQGVLIPRDDTEVLVRACIDLLNNKNIHKIIDLCSGSGIIAVTLKKEFPDSTVYAVEKSETAYSFLTLNAELNKTDVHTINADLYENTDDFEDNSLDLIVSNPPYIIRDEIKTLQSEVQKEPQMALDGGIDGYDFYRGIIKLWSKKLKHGGYIAFELGEDQFDFVSELLKTHNFTDIKGYLDLGNTVRAVTAVYNPQNIK